MARANARMIANVIRDGGLAHKKAGQLVEIARRFNSIGNGQALRTLSDLELESALRSLPGVGQKTARCVAMYALDRNVFPVDAHVVRVMRRLGYTAAHRVTPAVGDALQEAVPAALRVQLHIDLLSHGRTICRETRPLCASCPLGDLCLGRSRIRERMRPQESRAS